MPKIVNPAERREQVAAAVLAVAARSGLGNVTMREVAREAGGTTGTLSHYFRDKHELLVFAFQHAQRRVVAMRRRSARGPSPVADLHALLTATLPLDDERRAICAIFLEFHAQALSTADLADAQREAHADVCRRIADLLRSAIEAGEIDAGVDVERQGEILVAFVVGLAREALLHPQHYTKQRQLTLLDDVLARLAPRPMAVGRRGAGTAARAS